MWHRIEDDCVAESTDTDPAGRFHHSLIWVADGGAGALQGWRYIDGVFLPPVSPPEVTIGELRNRARAEMQVQRDLFLSRLTGIALFTDNQSAKQECAALRVDLLDITKATAFLEAQNYEDMRAALLARYRAIASGASEDIRNVFRELDA